MVKLFYETLVVPKEINESKSAEDLVKQIFLLINRYPTSKKAFVRLLGECGRRVRRMVEGEKRERVEKDLKSIFEMLVMKGMRLLVELE